MTAEGWRELVVQAVDRNAMGDSKQLYLLARLLEEQDLAKQALRDKGYGCTGRGWLDTIGEVPSANRRVK